MKAYLNKLQLKRLGFTKIGKNNKISSSLKTFKFKGKLGSNNRIDDDVIIKGKATRILLIYNFCESLTIHPPTVCHDLPSPK